MIAITNEEKYLAKIAGEELTTPEPVLRKEQYLSAIANGEGATPELPVTREERYLAILAGENYAIPTPETRLERYMAKACGLDIDTPTPITNVEYYWAIIAEGKSWDIITITGTLPLTFEAKGEALKNYLVHGTAEGAGVVTENLWDGNLETFIRPGQSSTEYGFRITTPGTYSISTFGITEGYLYGRLYNSNDELLDNANIVQNGTKRTKTFTITSGDVLYLYDAISTSDASTERQRFNNWKITIISGSTAPTTYIPYGYKIPISLQSGVTENLYDIATQIVGEGLGYDGITPASTTSNRSDYISVNSNTAYTLWHNTTDSISRMIQFLDSSKTFFANTPPTSDTNPMTFTTPENCAYIRIAYPNTSTEVMLVKGSTAPDHYIPHRYTADYPLYIGSTKLGAEEYADYESGKVWKMVDGTLTPTDPPAPFPAITAYEGENTLSSTETVGEVSVTGKIKEAENG